MPLKALLCVFLLFDVSTARAQTFERAEASIPPEGYVTPYVEDDTGQKSHSLKIDGHFQDYQLYIPQQYKATNRPYPLIVLLHGALRTGVSLVDKWKNLADEKGLILVGPTNWQSTWTLTKEEADTIEAITQHVTKQMRIDTQRLYLFGHSSGGHMATLIAMWKPNLFSAIAVNAGFFPEENHEYKMKASDRKIPIIFITGENDRTVPANTVLNSARLFGSKDHETLFVEYARHNHWYYTIADEINRKAYDFFERFEK